MVRLFFLSLFVLGCGLTYAQHRSEHESHLRLFRKLNFKKESDYDQAYGIDTTGQKPASTKCLRRKEIYGWHPAWSGSAYDDYDFPLLSGVSYFAYEVDPATGSYTTLNQWKETDLVDKAHAGASQVELTATCFGSSDNAKLLGSSKSTQTLRDSLVKLVLLKDADGVCIDFEEMASAQKDAFSRFILSLADTLHKLQPRRNLTVCIPAIDHNKVFDVAKLVPVTDRFALMAYDYHWSSAPNTGPVSPATDVRSSVQYYLNAGLPPQQLLLGLPYYGYKWPTKSQDPGTATTGKGSAVLLRNRIESSSGMDYTRDDPDNSPYWMAKDGSAQLWIDDTTSYAVRTQLVDEFDLAGVAIWALGYDNGLNDYWDFLKAHFADCSAEQVEEAEAQNEIPGSGVTSAERNEYHWIWMLGGGLVAVVIIILVRKAMR